MNLAAENRCVESRGELGEWIVSNGGRAPGWWSTKAPRHTSDVLAALVGTDAALHPQQGSAQTAGVSP